MSLNLVDFGAIGDDKEHDENFDAFVRAFENIENSSETVLYVPSGKYQIPIKDETRILHIPSNCTVYGDGRGKSSIKFVKRHSGKTFSVMDSKDGGDAYGITIHDLDFVGGTLDKSNRVGAVEVSGSKILIKDCEFRYFANHCLGVSGRYGQDWIVDGQYNSLESVNNLLNAMTSDVNITGCTIIDGGDGCFRSFGQKDLRFTNNLVDGTNAKKSAVLIDDNSTLDKIENIQINDNIIFSNNIIKGAGIFMGIGKAIISNNIVEAGRHTRGEITFHSFSLEQQVKGDGSIVGGAAIPFFYLNYMERRIQIHNNQCNNIFVFSGGHVDVNANYVKSSKNDSLLIGVSPKQVLRYYDSIFMDREDASSYNYIRNNILECNHENVHGIAGILLRGIPQGESKNHRTLNNVFVNGNRHRFVKEDLLGNNATRPFAGFGQDATIYATNIPSSEG